MGAREIEIIYWLLIGVLVLLQAILHSVCSNSVLLIATCGFTVVLIAVAGHRLYQIMQERR